MGTECQGRKAGMPQAGVPKVFPEWALGAGRAVLFLVLSQILQALPHGE